MRLGTVRGKIIANSALILVLNEDDGDVADQEREADDGNDDAHEQGGSDGEHGGLLRGEGDGLEILERTGGVIGEHIAALLDDQRS